MANLNIWLLVNNKGIIIAKGKRKDMINVRYIRYTRQHIYDDKLIRTDIKLNA